MRLKAYRGTWCVYWRDETGGRRISLGTSDAEEAERLFKDWLKTQSAPKKDALISDVVENYIAHHAGRKIVHPDAMRMSWRRANPFFGKYRPHQVDDTLVRQFVEKRTADGIKINTIRKQLSILAAAIAWHDPALEGVVEMPSPDPPLDRHLTRQEAKTMLGKTKQSHLRLFIILALSTAARPGAVLELKWERVDFERRRINLGKSVGNKGRAIVPMTDDAYEALMEAKKWAISDYVVEYGGGGITSVRSAFITLRQQTGFHDVTPRVIRHTAAVWMAESGTPMSEIAQYLGHKSSRTTERVYARYSPEYLAKAAAALNIT